MASDHGILPEGDGWVVRFVPETGSTNADLLAAVEAGTASGRIALRTDHQTAGRGRLDRRWDAPVGANLLVSLLFTDLPDRPSRLSQLVGLAAVQGVEQCVGRPLGGRLGLKWPNDVLLDGKKLAGVLAQHSAATGAVVVGLGLNVGWAPPGAASIVDDLRVEAAPDDLLRHLLAQVDRLAAVDVGDAYRSRLLTLGQRVRVELPAGASIIGTAVDVDRDGRLLVDVDGGARRSLDVGDVVHLRPA